MAGKKTCYVICPLDTADSGARDRSDKFLKFIIEPVVTKLGYDSPNRSDKDQADMITPAIIKHLFEDDLVLADLTDYNPNVFYELAIRHMVQKPVIPLILNGQKLPFDTKDIRTVFVDTDVKAFKAAKAELKKRIQSIEQNTSSLGSPIKTAVTSLGLQIPNFENMEKGGCIKSGYPKMIERIIQRQFGQGAFFKTNIIYEVEFSKLLSDFVIINTKFSYDITNFSAKSQSRTTYFRTGEHNSQVISFKINNENKIYLNDPCFHTAHGFTVNHTIKPHETVSIYWHVMSHYHLIDSEFYITEVPSADLMLTVINDFDNIELSFEPNYYRDVHPLQKSKDITFSIKEGLLPYQGVRMNWKPK